MTLKATLTATNFDLTTIRSVLIESDGWHQVEGGDFAINGDVVTFSPVLSPEVLLTIPCCGTVRVGIDRIQAVHTVPKS